MTTDPKKNDEIKDEELQNVSGGVGEDKTDENPLDAPPDKKSELPYQKS
ncbi:MAG: hypothetical protein IH987_16930 [Planctomycetes bacterium]|nr:hypothetical protein [Planctomycetota bacterium]